MAQAATTSSLDALLVTAVPALALGVLVLLWLADVIRPGSFRRRGIRDLSLLPWWGWFAAGAAMYVGAQVGLVVALAAAQALGHGGTGGSGGAGTLPLAGQAIVGAGHYLGGIVTGGAVLWALAGRADLGRMRAAGLGARARDVLIGAAWFLASMPVVLVVMQVSSLIASQVSSEPLDPIAHDTLREIVERRAEPWAWVLVAHAVLGAPIYEELFYRVFVQSGLLALFRRGWPALLTASAGFALAHYGISPWHALPGIFTLGLAMGLAYERSRSPLVPMTMHALFNGSMVAAALLS